MACSTAWPWSCTRPSRARAAITRSSRRGGRTSGHWDIAGVVTPTARARPVTEPNRDTACDFSMDEMFTTLTGGVSRGRDRPSVNLPYMNTMGERIRARRALLGDKFHSQSWLAKQAKVSRSAVSQWENGSTMTLEGPGLVRAARALLTTEDWILTGRDPRCDALGSLKRGAAVEQPVYYPTDIMDVLNALMRLPMRVRRPISDLVVRLAPWDGENDRRRPNR